MTEKARSTFDVDWDSYGDDDLKRWFVDLCDYKIPIDFPVRIEAEKGEYGMAHDAMWRNCIHVTMCHMDQTADNFNFTISHLEKVSFSVLKYLRDSGEASFATEWHFKYAPDCKRLVATKCSQPTAQ